MFFRGVSRTPPGSFRYRLTTMFFIRALALVYLAAFVSFAIQIKGLVGENGILPAGTYLRLVGERLGAARFWRVPTLAWFASTDTALIGFCWAGAFFAALLFTGLLPGVSALALWLLYLSLVHFGQDFLSFQWDILLLETGFLFLFLVPWNWREKFARREPKFPVVIWYYRALFFRLMVGSGLVKWLSGDRSWHELTALTFHYETTPLPVWTGWFFHQGPPVFQRVSCALMFVIEILVPFLIFAGRKGRVLCFILQVGFQLLLMGTGNYAFFNLLALTLCISILDDGCFKGRSGCFFGKFPPESKPVEKTPANADFVKRWRGLPSLIVFPVLGLVTLLSLMSFSGTLRWRIPWPTPLKVVERLTAPFCFVNHYGLFAVMTRHRPEIIIEGSSDGQIWKPYEFRWKPGDLNRRPEFVAPHQPRLDWQMWFAALGNYRNQPWFLFFLKKLMSNDREVLALLKYNPFGKEPPRYLRAVRYDYHFTTAEERKRTGAWWKRRPLGLYCPILARIGSSIFFTHTPAR